MSKPKPLILSNRQARLLLLQSTGLLAPPSGPTDGHSLNSLIEDLGFVQLDTLRIVSRAHDHILWSRNRSYREPMLDALLANDRLIFEHFTHDASVLPISLYPLWRRQFDRLARKIKTTGLGKRMPGAKERRALVKRIEREGPLCSRDFTSQGAKIDAGWVRPAHKFGLDYLWYKGELATAHRTNFVKYYDLSERVIPTEVSERIHSEQEQVSALCEMALKRLCIATPGQIQSFWDAMDLEEVKNWLSLRPQGQTPVTIAMADKSNIEMLACDDLSQRLDNLPKPPRRLRVINPFDPLVRDRNRLSKVFGFDYRIEIFVPAAKRRYGYYVFPILDGLNFVGRLQLKADRKTGVLNVGRIWPEPGYEFAAGRQERLDREIRQLAKLCNCSSIAYRQDFA